MTIKYNIANKRYLKTAVFMCTTTEMQKSFMVSFIPTIKNKVKLKTKFWLFFDYESEPELTIA